MPWGQGGSTAWRRTRKVVLDRDAYTCQLRYPGCTGEATEVDHIINIASTGTSRRDAVEPEDCMAVCHSCHQRKTSVEQALGRTNARRGRRPRQHPSDVL